MITNVNDKPNVRLYANVFYRKIGRTIARWLARTGLRPNQVSVSGLIFAIISGWFFSIGHYQYLLLGAFFANLFLLADSVDGELARLKSMSSHYGAWLDTILGKAGDFFIFFGICWGIADSRIWMLGFIALAGRLFIAFFPSVTEACIPSEQNLFKAENEKGSLRKAFIFSHANLIVLFTIAAAVNRMFLFMMLIAGYSWAFFVASFLYFNHKIKKQWAYVD